MIYTRQILRPTGTWYTLPGRRRWTLLGARRSAQRAALAYRPVPNEARVLDRYGQIAALWRPNVPRGWWA